MDIRCIHLDMKSLFPKADYFAVMLEELAEVGYTHVLLEFEDLFLFDKYQGFQRKSAFTKEELRSIGKKCASLGLGVVPLLQCAGHLDYFLKEKRYSHLRENNNPYQWCLSDPASWQVWTDMAEEILEVFPECEYFHIGADEVRLKDPCDLCKGKDPFELYLSRVEKCARFIADRGKKVLMWDDMFRKREIGPLADLLKLVTPCVWQYREVKEEVLARYAQYDIPFWGASRIQVNTDTYTGMGRQPLMQKNVDDWALAEEKYPSVGHIGTIWGRIQSLYPINVTVPQSMYMAAYQGQSLQHGLIRDRKAFNKEFAKSYFGSEELDMDLLVENFGIEPDVVKAELEKFLGKVPRHNDTLEIWHAFNEIDVLYRYIEQCFSNNRASVGKYRRGYINDAMITNWLDGVRITEERATALRAVLVETLGKYFPADQLEEFLEERFDGMLEQNELWGKFLREVASKPHV